MTHEQMKKKAEQDFATMMVRDEAGTVGGQSPYNYGTSEYGVFSYLSGLTRSIELLDQRLSTLAERLAPVCEGQLAPNDPPKGVSPAPAVCELAKAIGASADVVNTLSNRVQYLLETLNL